MARETRSPVEIAGEGWPTFVPVDLPAAIRQAVGSAAAFARVVRAERLRRHWSLAELADRAELRPAAVGNIEAGRSWPDTATMAAIAQALSLTLSITALTSEEVVALAQARKGEVDVGSPTRMPASGQPLTPAQVIEAMFAMAPQLERDVAELRKRRRAARTASAPYTVR